MCTHVCVYIHTYSVHVYRIYNMYLRIKADKYMYLYIVRCKVMVRTVQLFHRYSSSIMLFALCVVVSNLNKSVCAHTLYKTCTGKCIFISMQLLVQQHS